LTSEASTLGATSAIATKGVFATIVVEELAGLEIEQSATESQSVVSVANLKRYVVQAYRARFSCFNHTTLR
jgi:hypothetical protein